MQRSRFSSIRMSIAIAFMLVGCIAPSQKDPPGTVYLALPEKIKGLDPIAAGDLYSGLQVGMAYEGLLQYHYLKRPYQLAPNLAEAMPTYSKDKKTITFKIKKGVLFHDDPCFKETQGKGRELTADDVVYSFLRVADPKLESTSFWVFENKIVGIDEWRAEAQKSGKADYSKSIEGLKSIDRYTLQIKLKEPSYVFLYSLAMPAGHIVAREAVEMYGSDFVRHPVGTGPFRLVADESNLSSKLVWVKNPTYRKELYPSEGAPGDREAGLLEDAGLPLPRSEKIVFQVFTESQPKWLNFMAGKLDAIGVPKDNFAQAVSPNRELTEEFQKKNIKLHKTPKLDITHDSFNMADPLFAKNKYLRQAISIALNAGPWIDLFYNGLALPAQGPIPPGLNGYDPNLKNPYRQFNLQKAKELLAKAGYPDGKGLPEIEYMTLASSTYRQMSEYLVKVLGEIGVKLKINTYTWPEFLANIKNKKGQMWGYAWGADYPDAENFLQLFYSKNASPGPNDSNYSNPDYDRLYEASLKLPDSPARTELYKKMVKILVEDAPWIWGVHRIDFYLAHPWFKNYKPIEMEHNYFKYYRIDPALKTGR